MLDILLRDKRINILKLTLKEISKNIGFSYVYLSKIERGEKIPRNGITLMKLSNGYKISIDNILNELMKDIKIEAETSI